MWLGVMSFITLAACGFMVVLWRQRQVMHSLLADLSRAQVDLKRQVKSLELALRRAREDHDVAARTLASIDDVQAKERQGYSHRITEQELHIAELERRLRDTQSQRDLMEAQQEKLLQEVSRLRERLTNDQTLVSQLRAEAQDLEEQLTAASSRIVKLEATSVPKAELEVAKTKLRQYEVFYLGMRGRKEMLEEQNANFAQALDRMSEWILRSQGGGSSLLGSESPPDGDSPRAGALGSRVASALEKIGVSLNEVDVEASVNLENNTQGV